MLYGFLKKNIYWQEGKRAKFKAFHVTPYLDEILTQGELLPPSVTHKSVLGENIGQHTIRGCLLSFFDDFQTAMNGCYNLALYAILDKNLLTDDEFESLIRSEISMYGISEDESLEYTPEDEIIEMLLQFYHGGDTDALFNMLGRALEPFKNPVILTDAWISDLPNDIDGILNAIGVIEVEFDCKYIADPSTKSGGYDSRVYGYIDSKGNFGLDLQGLNYLYSDNAGYYDEDAESQAMGYESTELAQYINRVCESTSATLTDLNVEGELENAFGDLDEFEEVSTRYGDSWVYEDAVAFVPKVTINPQDLAIWNPEEHEWRIPAPNGIKVDASNVVARAGEVTLAVSGKSNKLDTLVYKESEVRGRRKNPKEYTLIYGSELEDGFGDFESTFGVDPDTLIPWDIAYAAGIGIRGNKEFHAGHMLNGQLVSVLYVAPPYEDCFSFDVAVLPKYQAKGLGAELVDVAMDVFEDYYEYYDEDGFMYCVDVVNPHMKSLLERKGFHVHETSVSGDRWLMRK